MTPDPVAVPDGWHRVRLGDLGRFVNGRAFKPSDWGQSGLPIVRIQNLTSAEAPFNHYDGEVGDDNLIDTGDIVVSWSASIEARTWDRGPAVLNQHIFKVVERSGVADKRFLFFLLEAATSELRRRVHGTTMQHVTKGTFDSTPALLPPLAEQRAIATVLDAIDEAIERSEEVIAATERLRDALLHELLTRGLPGRHSEWAAVPGLGTVPACWDVVRLGEVCAVVGGTTPSRGRPDYWGGDVPWVVPSELTGLSGRYLDASRESITHEGVRAAGLRLIPPRSVLLTTRATIGVTAINRVPVTTNQGFQNLVPNGGTDSLWLYYLIAAMRRELEKRGAGSTFLEVSRDSVRSLRVPFPALEEQQAIAAVLDGVDGAIERAREERARLHSLQASAGDALLTGRVRVRLDASA